VPASDWICAIIRRTQRAGCMQRDYYAYILTNHRHTVLYTGVTNDLTRRVP